ncbi:MAG: diacylglycerol kinase family lipid kinase [Planctomycetes bacterium]|nr:diacylglycerol kinase family lipid kinase [Planctomycetota bacterium]
MSESRSVLILANPISGRGRGRTAAGELADRLRAAGHDVQLAFTGGPGDARARAATLGPGVDRLAVVGGDGTVNEVLSGLVRFDVPVALLPTGTANLLGRELGLSGSPAETADLLHAGRTRRFDVGEAGDRRFLSVAGVGFDAEAVRRLANRRRGPITQLSYVRPVLAALIAHRPPPLRVRVDGEIVAERAAWVLVCNVRHYAGYFAFTPAADPSDGLLDVCILNSPSRLRLAGLCFKALCHRTGRPPVVTYARGSHIEIDSTQAPAPCELDGDPAGHTPLEIRLRPAALRLLAP